MCLTVMQAQEAFDEEEAIRELEEERLLQQGHHIHPTGLHHGHHEPQFEAIAEERTEDLEEEEEEEENTRPPAGAGVMDVAGGLPMPFHLQDGGPSGEEAEVRDGGGTEPEAQGMQETEADVKEDSEPLQAVPSGSADTLETKAGAGAEVSDDPAPSELAKEKSQLTVSTEPSKKEVPLWLQ